MTRILRRVILAPVLLIVLYLLAATFGGLLPGRAADLPDGSDHRIGLLYGPIHVDFLLPATDETRAALDFAQAAGVPIAAPDVGYIVVGWGAHDFYTGTPNWSDLTAGATFRAVTGDRSVLRIDVTGRDIAFDQVPQIALSDAQYSALLAAIAASAQGEPVVAEGHGRNAGFVTAEGRFHILRTCNTWLGAMLRAAGIEAGAWTPTPYSVRLSLWRAGL
ncbi:TIGR02117 family protein [Gymnodinialimonas sp. 2305UL16-5]|uniref:TIGR02117 family protein n=1 Tax=Gymnodinialimonas mytili TaxID=3126503 RepID=UPI0030B59793